MQQVHSQKVNDVPHVRWEGQVFCRFQHDQVLAAFPRCVQPCLWGVPSIDIALLVSFHQPRWGPLRPYRVPRLRTSSCSTGSWPSRRRRQTPRISALGPSVDPVERSYTPESTHIDHHRPGSVAPGSECFPLATSGVLTGPWDRLPRVQADDGG